MRSIAAVLLVLAAASASPATAQPAAPPVPQAAAPAAADTPATAQAMRLLRAAQTTDETGFRLLVKDIYPTADFATAEWNEMRDHLAQMQFHGVASASATHAELYVFNSGMERWMKAVVDVAPTEPHTISYFGLRMSTRPPDIPAPPRLQPDQLIAAARSMIDTEAAGGRFSGAVLVASGDQTLFAGAYGKADETTNTPNKVTTQFRFGSIGKMFTAVAIMQLAQAGKLDLDAPVGRYLPDYPNAEIAAKVTINELLTHSGGTGDIFGPDFDAHRDTLRTPSDYVALYGARPPLFPPGSRQDYSNYGFMLLGRIVEVVAGQSFDAYLQQHIFTPAGMTTTGMQPESVAMPNRAVAYSNVAGHLEAVTGKSLAARGARTDGYVEYRGGPAGGGYSTVEDFQRFGRALTSNRLLDAEHTALLTQGRVRLPNGVMAGYDFGGPTEDGRRFIGHAGGAPGQSAVFRIYPDGYTIVVLANRDPPAAERIMTFIADRLP